MENEYLKIQHAIAIVFQWQQIKNKKHIIHSPAALVLTL